MLGPEAARLPDISLQGRFTYIIQGSVNRASDCQPGQEAIQTDEVTIGYPNKARLQ